MTVTVVVSGPGVPFGLIITSFHTRSGNIVPQSASPPPTPAPPYPGATPLIHPSSLPALILTQHRPHPSGSLSGLTRPEQRTPFYGLRSAGDLSRKPTLPSLSPCRAAACRAYRDRSKVYPFKVARVSSATQTFSSVQVPPSPTASESEPSPSSVPSLRPSPSPSHGQLPSF